MASPLEFSIEVSPELALLSQRMSGVADKLMSTMTDAGQQALAIAKRYAPQATGTFAQGLNVEQNGASGFVITTNEPELANMLRTGTGVYGPTGQRIMPVSARALVLGQWNKAGVAPNFREVWAFKSVAGMQANPWEELAKTEITATSTDFFAEQLLAFLEGE